MYNFFLGIALFIACANVVFIIAYFVMRQYSVPRPLAPPPDMLDETDSQQTTISIAQCPWCGGADFTDANPPFICNTCGTVHHRKCWDLYGGCSTHECDNAPLHKPHSKVLSN